MAPSERITFSEIVRAVAGYAKYLLTNLLIAITSENTIELKTVISTLKLFTVERKQAPRIRQIY
jgi:hypothetical protein